MHNAEQLVGFVEPDYVPTPAREVLRNHELTQAMERLRNWKANQGREEEVPGEEVNPGEPSGEPADTKTPTGAVRSADANHYDFVTMPWVGIMAVARTSAEGAAKYGGWNYMKGFPVTDILNHAIRHVVMWILGDRSEPHLEHAAWNLLAAISSITLDPHLSEHLVLGPGATIGESLGRHLDECAPELARRRAGGEFDRSGEWQLKDLPEIVKILKQRSEALGR